MTPPLLAYYGDDFTGSTDVMEVLQWSGIKTVLFLDPPTPAQLQSFPDLRAFGVAGFSRTMSPDEMQSDLKPALERLRETGAAIVHYKICSTFDSSPQIGNVGKAIDLGRSVFGSATVPLLIAAPDLGRYQTFGNLFARSGLDSEPSRLDRHPTMSQHPITPMLEADVRVHLAKQTTLQSELVDCQQLNELEFGRSEVQPGIDRQVLLFDALYPSHMPRIGEMIDRLSQVESPLFVVGSSGIEHALSSYWAESESNGFPSRRSHDPNRPPFGPTDQIVALTGSCSPVNDRQITWAEQNGFETLAIVPARLVDPATCDQEIERCVESALDLLRRDVNLILHSCRGPDDPRVAQTFAAFQQQGLSDLEIKLRSGRTLGPKFGQILTRILKEHRLRRIGLAGGDTSGYVARELEIQALEAIAPVAPGSPLCRIASNNETNGVEVVFKGGQVGRNDFWTTLLSGTQI